jgi:hypothetical protein
VRWRNGPGPGRWPGLARCHGCPAGGGLAALAGGMIACSRSIMPAK